MTQTVLITGGLGYVGGRITKFLSENSDSNLIIADIGKNVPDPTWLKKGKIVNLDLCSEKLDDICKGVDCIIHLAATNEIESGENPEKALLVNGMGSLKLLRSAEKNKVKRFLYFSTAHVYKSPLSGTIDEVMLTRPGHPYAITHKVAEDFILASHDRRNIDGIIIRMSNSFGAPVNPEVNRWTLLVNDLCRQVVATKKLTLKSSGTQERDFVTLEDVCRAVLHLLYLPSDKIGDGIFNLGGEKSLSI
ncbi:MAG: SDR family oxidoreductase, partial [bacterium]